MIWLSPASGTNECSIYFDIRDIDLQCSGVESTGVIRGLIGDGTCELWGEVFLGDKEFAQILPVWTEAGVIESFSDAVDQSLLLQQMLSEVKSLLQRMNSVRECNQLFAWVSRKSTEYCPTHHLAA
ncbi:MAG: hypothetical protein U9Q61_05225 [Thermodesulfobacteriota bacterium]|nr:hypothetical protein [Thermodesulfobacteriota bacterium]